MRLYCENCDQCFNGRGDPQAPRSFSGIPTCSDCGEKLVSAEAFLAGERQAHARNEQETMGEPDPEERNGDRPGRIERLWKGYHDEDHD